MDVLDLRNSFNSIQIPEELQEFFKFRLNDQWYTMKTLPHGFSSATKLLLLATNLCLGSVNLVMEKKYSIAASNILSTESTDYWDNRSQAEASVAFNDLFGPDDTVADNITMAQLEPILPCLATQRVLHYTGLMAERQGSGTQINNEPILLHTQQPIAEQKPVTQCDLDSQVLGRQAPKRYQISKDIITSLAEALGPLNSSGDQSQYHKAFANWIEVTNLEHQNQIQNQNNSVKPLGHGDFYVEPDSIEDADGQKEIINITQLLSEFLFLRYEAADPTSNSLAMRQLARTVIYVDDYIFQGKWRPLAHEYLALAYIFNLVAGLCPSGKKV